MKHDRHYTIHNRHNYFLVELLKRGFWLRQGTESACNRQNSHPTKAEKCRSRDPKIFEMHIQMQRGLFRIQEALTDVPREQLSRKRSTAYAVTRDAGRCRSNVCVSVAIYERHSPTGTGNRPTTQALKSLTARRLPTAHLCWPT